MEDNVYSAAEIIKLPQGIVGYALGQLETLVPTGKDTRAPDVTLVRLVDDTGAAWLRVLYVLPENLLHEVVKVKFYVNAELQTIVADSSCLEVLQTVTSDRVKPLIVTSIARAKMHVGDRVQISGTTTSKIAAGDQYSTQLTIGKESINVLVNFAKSFDDYFTGAVTLTGIITSDGKLLVENAEDWLSNEVIGERNEDPVGSITKQEAIKLPIDTVVTICGWCQNAVKDDGDVLSIKDNNNEYLIVKLVKPPWPYVCKGDRVSITGKLELGGDSTGGTWYRLIADDKNAIKFLYIATSDTKKPTTTTTSTTTTYKSYTKCHTGNVLVYQHASGAGLYLGGWTRDAWPKLDWAVIDLTGNKDLKSGEIAADDPKSASAFSNVLASALSDNIVLRLPIKDMGVPAFKREVWLALVEDIQKLLEAGTNILMCCTGGHGRTGLAGAILLGLLTDDEAIKTDPITWLRKNYCEEIVETQPQAQYVWSILELTGAPPTAATKYYQGNHQNWQQGKLATNTNPKVGTRHNTTTTNGSVSGKKNAGKLLCDACHMEINDIEKSFSVAGFVICKYCKESDTKTCCLCEANNDVILAAPGWIKKFNEFMDRVEVYYCQEHLPLPAYSICTECGCAVKLTKWLVDPVCVDCWKKTNTKPN